MPAALDRLGWQFLQLHPAAGAEETEYVWRIDSDHTFHYRERADYPIEYCVVAGPRANELLMLVSSQLDFLDVDDLLAAFDRASTGEERQVTTFALGMAAGETPEDDIAARIRAACSDEDARVRMAAVDAAFVTGWNTFVPELERLSRSDPDARVREVATTASTARADKSD